MDDHVQDICRVCRCESQPDKILYHPCICMGSIKWIHQECLVQWMRYSRKTYCELCGHNFSFEPIYAPDMPKILPISVIIKGLLSTFGSTLKCWFHYIIIACMWLGIMPFCAYRTYRFFFYGSVDMNFSSPFYIVTVESLANDILRGSFVVTCTLIAFIGLVWLREQIIHAGGPDWLQLPDGGGERNNFRLELPLRRPPPILQDIGDERLEMYVNVDAPRDQDNQNEDELQQRENGQENDSNIDADDKDVEIVNVDVENSDEDHIYNEIHSDASGSKNTNESAENSQNNNNDTNNISIVNYNVNNENNDVNNSENENLDIWNNNNNENNNLNFNENQNNDNRDNFNLNLNNEENAFNPLEWERAAEDLTWERLLGLDGSMIFIEHVFWVVLLNVIFIFIFAFLPYIVGHILIAIVNSLYPHKILDNVHGFVAVLVGYLVISIVLIEMYALADICRLRRLQRVFGLCYIVIKVALLSVIEIGILPLLCGWWLDICSLPLFDSTMEYRKNTFKKAFGTLTFLYWMFGMVYVYYFASFIVLLREILRPEALWFLRNFNDPDFSPIQEMIHLPTSRHIKRLITSSIIFGSAVLLLVWLPIRILTSLWPTFLPYTLSEDWETHGLGMPLLLLQIILPGLLEQHYVRSWIKAIVKFWCTSASWLLGLEGCLLNDGSTQNTNEEVANPEPVKSVAESNSLNSNVTEAAAQPTYRKPNYFRVRIVALLLLASLTFVVGSLVTLTVPIWIGRYSIGFFKKFVKSISSSSNDFVSQPHELYTTTIGIYLCCIAIRSTSLCFNFMSEGSTTIMGKIRSFLSLVLKYVISGSVLLLLLAVIPLLFGILLEVVVVIPLRVPLEQTPIVFLWQDWILGILYTKITCVLILMGPDSRAKQILEQCCRNGFRDINVRFIFEELAIPVLIALGLALSIPYVVAHSIVPLLCSNSSYNNLIARRIYPTVLLLVFVIFIVGLIYKQLKRTCATIKNNRYLIGQQLVNYSHDLEKRARSSVQNKA